MTFRGGYRFNHFTGAAKPALSELSVPGQAVFPLDHPLFDRYEPAMLLYVKKLLIEKGIDEKRVYFDEF